MSRSQRTDTTQTATTTTTTRVSQQQLLNAELLGLGEDELFQRVENEMNENLTLEKGGDSDKDDTSDESDGGFDEDGGDRKSDAVDATKYAWDDDNDAWVPAVEEPKETLIGDKEFFIDTLLSQISDHNMADEKQEKLVKYLIYSLNDKGYIDRPLDSISDDLLFQHNVDGSEDELEAALRVLQNLDPPGIGARDLQECMLLQIDRKIEDTPKVGNLQRLMVLQLARQVVVEHFNLFKSADHRKLFETLNVPQETFDDVMKALKKLNPRPGLSLSEGADGTSHTVVPDFIIETDLDGNISVSLRNSRIPQLRVSQSCLDWISEKQATKASLSDSDKELLKDMKSKVERAERFIEAIRKRRETLYRMMDAIKRQQRTFMLTQDKNDLKPLTGGEIAKMVGVDNSTISRAISNRYASLNGTLYPLKDFFLRTRTGANGKDVLRYKVENAIQDVIDHEDKSNPLSDDKIAKELIRYDVHISRRTVAKYRDQMRIPEAKMRRVF